MIDVSPTGTTFVSVSPSGSTTYCTKSSERNQDVSLANSTTLISMVIADWILLRFITGNRYRK